MTIKEAYNYIEENWEGFVEELIDENLTFLLEYEDLDEDEIEQYDCFDELPVYLKESVWRHQAEHIQNELQDYARWYASRNSEEAV